MDVCEYNAIEVISLEEGELIDFKIDIKTCNLCKNCLEGGFCFKNLFDLNIDQELGKELIIFNRNNIKECKNCLKCVITCPKNAIIPIISLNNDK